MFKKLKTLYSRTLLRILLKRIQVPLDKAVAENRRRQKDAELRTQVQDFLNNDIPVHFDSDSPIFYLSRYVATPDYETLHFYMQVKKYDWPVVIGEDHDDIFTSHSSLKRNLLKLPIINGWSRNGADIVERVTIGDFNSNQGRKLSDIKLFNQKRLVDFHKELCNKFLPSDMLVKDESGWVNNNQRGDLIAVYEKMLALFLVHGVMLEQYEADEIDFLKEVVLPAMSRTKKRFGHAPLIASLDLRNTRNIDDLNSYPPKVGEYIKSKI